LIVEVFFAIATGLVGSVFGLLPADSLVPDQILPSVDNIVQPFANGMASLGAWVPWGAIVNCAPFVFGAYVVALFVRALRVILGHLPLIGGNG
jgi:hypothetical protein